MSYAMVCRYVMVSWHCLGTVRCCSVHGTGHKTLHPKAGGSKRTHVPEFLSTGKSGQENSSFFTLKGDSLFQEDGGESTRRCSWFPRFVVF